MWKGRYPPVLYCLSKAIKFSFSTSFQIASDRAHSINIESRLVNSTESLSENSMEVTLTWEAPVDEIRPSIYFISLVDALISPKLDCRNPGDHPPCFFTTDTVSYNI